MSDFEKICDQIDDLDMFKGVNRMTLKEFACYFWNIQEERIQKLQQENAELKTYKEKWQEISGKANAIHCLKEVGRLEKENSLLKQAVEKLEKCREFYGDRGNWSFTMMDRQTKIVHYNNYFNDEEWDEADASHSGKLARQTEKEVSELLRWIK